MVIDLGWDYKSNQLAPNKKNIFISNQSPIAKTIGFAPSTSNNLIWIDACLFH